MRRIFVSLLALLAVAVVAFVLFDLMGESARALPTRTTASAAGSPAVRSGKPSKSPQDPAPTSNASPAISARGADDARDVLEICIRDPQGQPLTEGAISWRCKIADELENRPSVALDSSGCASGRGCAGQTTCVTLHHRALAQKGDWVGQGRERIMLDTSYKPSIQGHVIGPDLQPLASAEIYVKMADAQWGEANLPWAPIHTTTDAEGFFSLHETVRPNCDPCRAAAGRCDQEDELPWRYEGQIVISVVHPLYPTVEKSIESAAGEVSIRLDNVGADMKVRVVDAQGQPFPRLKLLARAIAERFESKAAVKQNDGSYLFSGLGAGDFRISAFQDGNELISQEVPSTVGELRLVVPQVASGVDWTVRIVDRNGHPRRNILVEGGPFHQAQTEESGELVGHQVLPGTYLLRLSGSGVRAKSHQVEVKPAASDKATELVVEFLAD